MKSAGLPQPGEGKLGLIANDRLAASALTKFLDYHHFPSPRQPTRRLAPTTLVSTCQTLYQVKFPLCPHPEKVSCQEKVSPKSQLLRVRSLLRLATTLSRYLQLKASRRFDVPVGRYHRRGLSTHRAGLPDLTPLMSTVLLRYLLTARLVLVSLRRTNPAHNRRVAALLECRELLRRLQSSTGRQWAAAISKPVKTLPRNPLVMIER